MRTTIRLAILSAVVFLASCSTNNHIEFAGHYNPKTDVKKSEMTTASQAEAPMQALPSKSSVNAIASSSDSQTDVAPQQFQPQQRASSPQLTEKQALRLEKTLEKVEQKLEKRATQLNSENRTTVKATPEKKSSRSADASMVLLIILAFLLPPLAVGLYEDDITTHFWISILLTLLFWVPGVIYALIIILG